MDQRKTEKMVLLYQKLETTRFPSSVNNIKSGVYIVLMNYFIHLKFK